MMKDKINCNIVQDLLPNYIENLTNEETNLYIEEHIKDCNSCKKLLEDLQKDFKLTNTKKEEREIKYFKKYNKKMKILKIIIIILLIIALGIMTCFYFYMKYAYKSAVSGTIDIVEQANIVEDSYNRDMEKVKIEIEEDSIKPTGLTLIITDENKYPFIWEDSYQIKVKENESWKTLTPITNTNSEPVFYTLDENGKKEQKIDWTSTYGTLPKGIYMITMHGYTSIGEVYIDSNEFEIK